MYTDLFHSYSLHKNILFKNAVGGFLIYTPFYLHIYILFQLTLHHIYTWVIFQKPS